MNARADQPAQCQPAPHFVGAHDESPAGCSNSAHPPSILPCHPPSGGQSTLHPPHCGHHRMCMADGLPPVTSSMVPLHIFGRHARPRATPPAGKKRSPWDPSGGLRTQGMGPPGHITDVGDGPSGACFWFWGPMDGWVFIFFGFGDLCIATLVVRVGRHPATRGFRHPSAVSVCLAVGVLTPALRLQTSGF